MIRLGSLAGYPFEGPRLLGGWTPPARPAVYAVLYKPDPKAETYAVSYVGHAMSPENVEMVLSHPLVMIGSDGTSMTPGAPDLGRPHPRSFGTYARLLGYYVRERRAMELTVAIRKMTSMPADQLGLADIAAKLKPSTTSNSPKEVSSFCPMVKRRNKRSGGKDMA